MRLEKKLTDPVAIRVWRNYMKRINHLVISLPSEQRDEILLEIESHLFESISHASENKEVEKLLDGIEKLGEPEIFLKPIVKERKISNVLQTYSPISVIRNFIFNPFENLKRFALNVLLGVGYFFLFIVFVISILKIFFPEVGLFVYPNGAWNLGVADDPAARELLGNWLIPGGITISIVLYIFLARLLQKLNKKRE